MQVSDNVECYISGCGNIRRPSTMPYEGSLTASISDLLLLVSIGLTNLVNQICERVRSHYK